MKILTTEEIQKGLSRLKGWTVNASKTEIEKKYTFENFTDAVCFANHVAEIAEEEDHHPDIHLTNYKHLRVVFSTHSAGGLTKKDFVLAEKVDKSQS